MTDESVDRLAESELTIEDVDGGLERIVDERWVLHLLLEELLADRVPDKTWVQLMYVQTQGRVPHETEGRREVLPIGETRAKYIEAWNSKCAELAAETARSTALQAELSAVREDERGKSPSLDHQTFIESVRLAVVELDNASAVRAIAKDTALLWEALVIVGRVARELRDAIEREATPSLSPSVEEARALVTRVADDTTFDELWLKHGALGDAMDNLIAAVRVESSTQTA